MGSQSAKTPQISLENIKNKESTIDGVKIEDLTCLNCKFVLTYPCYELECCKKIICQICIDLPEIKVLKECKICQNQPIQIQMKKDIKQVLDRLIIKCKFENCSKMQANFPFNHFIALITLNYRTFPTTKALVNFSRIYVINATKRPFVITKELAKKLKLHVFTVADGKGLEKWFLTCSQCFICQTKDHEASCDFKVVKCKGCKHKLFMKDMEYHKQKCPKLEEAEKRQILDQEIEEAKNSVQEPIEGDLDTPVTSIAQGNEVEQLKMKVLSLEQKVEQLEKDKLTQEKRLQALESLVFDRKQQYKEILIEQEQDTQKQEKVDYNS